MKNSFAAEEISGLDFPPSQHNSPLAINLAEGGVVGDVVLAGGLQLPGLLRLLAPLVELVALAHSAHNDQAHKAGLTSNVIHFT